MEAIDRIPISQDWISLLLVFVFLVLTVTKLLFPQRFTQFIMLFATNKYLLLQGREPQIFHPFHIMLFLVNILVVGLFGFIFFQSFGWMETELPQILYLRIATAYASFILLKFSVDKILANVLSVDDRMDYYLFYKLSYRNFIALILLPIIVVFIYFWTPPHIVLYLCLAVILLMNFGLIFSHFKKNQHFVSNHFFYFILYLCALEIGPYYILYKLITKLL